MSYEPWSLWINGANIVKNVKLTLYGLVHAPIAKEYWTSKGKTKFMKKWRQRSTVDCPCFYMLEDAAHVLVCHGPGVLFGQQA